MSHLCSPLLSLSLNRRQTCAQSSATLTHKCPQPHRDSTGSSSSGPQKPLVLYPSCSSKLFTTWANQRGITREQERAAAKRPLLSLLEHTGSTFPEKAEDSAWAGSLRSTHPHLQFAAHNFKSLPQHRLCDLLSQFVWLEIQLSLIHSLWEVIKQLGLDFLEHQWHNQSST